MAPPRAGNLKAVRKKQKSYGRYYVFAAVAIVSLIGLYMLVPDSSYFNPADLQPFKAPKMVDLPIFSESYKNSMLWGSYRSGLYFGMRARIPSSLIFGIMWFDPDDLSTLRQQRIRHAALQSDGLEKYGWIRHDGVSYGRQFIQDGDYSIWIDMIKHAGPESSPGGDWGVICSIKAKNATNGAKQRQRRISIVMYVGDEGTPSTEWSVMPDGEPTSLLHPVTLVTGGHPVLGHWSLHGSTFSPFKKQKPRLDYLSLGMETKDYLLSVKEIMLTVLHEQVQRNPSSATTNMFLPNGATTSSDLAFFQVTTAVTDDWSTAHFAYVTHQGPAYDAVLQPDMDDRLEELMGVAAFDTLMARDKQFQERYSATFYSKKTSKGKTGDADLYAEEEWDNVQTVASRALSNLVGSMGYFYGSSEVLLGDTTAQSFAAPLYTAVPSRSFFPRGFLWDEGFHQLVISRWDVMMSLDAMSHWLDLMNRNGWIAREQILGQEARSRVPAEFIVQNPLHANPPSLFLAIESLLPFVFGEYSTLHSDQAPPPVFPSAAFLFGPATERCGEAGCRPAVIEWLKRAWPRLDAWFVWLNTTQVGQIPGSYRWHGRNETTDLELNPKTLTSGLDDYPRSSHPSADERHVDLYCWMARTVSIMSRISIAADRPDHDKKRYFKHAAELVDIKKLGELHYSEEMSLYADWGWHTEYVKLQRKTVIVNNRKEEIATRVQNGVLKAQFVPTKGYVSLFPLLMRLVPPTSKHLEKIFDLMRNPRELWTDYGLRSLSKSAALYKQYNTLHDPPYWRGQIWININYLALKALHEYGHTEGPFADQAMRMGRVLRDNVVENLVKQYLSQGYLFEQYDDKSGKGTSSHPFTGWTSLLVLLDADDFDFPPLSSFVWSE